MGRVLLLCVVLVCGCGRSSFTDREVSTCAPDCPAPVVAPALIRANEELIPTALVPAGDDEVVLSGWLRRPAIAIPDRTLDIAGTQLTVDGAAGIVFVARLDTSLAATWARAYGAAGTDGEIRDTTSIGGDVLTCGIQKGTVRYQAQDAIADSGYQQPVLAEHDASGNLRDVRILPAARSNAQCLDIAGNTRMVAFAGLFGGDVTPGDTQFTALADPNSYLAVYDRPTMAPRWSRSLLDASQLTAQGVAIADDDAVYAGGWFQGESTFDGGALVAAAGTDAFVLRYAADGTAAWTATIGGPGDDRLSDMAALGDDVVICMRATSAAFTIGGVPVTTNGSGEAVIARIDAAGTGVWARSVSAPAGSTCTSVAIDADRNVHVGGTFTDRADFGDGSIERDGVHGFVATYDENGSLQRTSVIDAGTTLTDLAVTGANQVMALGTFDTTLTVGSDVYAAGGQRALFVMPVR